VKKESIGFSVAKDIDQGKNNQNFKTKFQYCLVYLFLVEILFLVFLCKNVFEGELEEWALVVENW
jgi:hypothetical protein